MHLDDAKQLLAWMRAEGVSSARVGDVSLVIGDAPVAEEYDDGARRPPRELPDGPENDPMLFDGQNVPGFIPVPLRSDT